MVKGQHVFQVSVLMASFFHSMQSCPASEKAVTIVYNWALNIASEIGAESV